MLAAGAPLFRARSAEALTALPPAQATCFVAREKTSACLQTENGCHVWPRQPAKRARFTHGSGTPARCHISLERRGAEADGVLSARSRSLFGLLAAVSSSAQPAAARQPAHRPGAGGRREDCGNDAPDPHAIPARSR